MLTQASLHVLLISMEAFLKISFKKKNLICHLYKCNGINSIFSTHWAIKVLIAHLAPPSCLCHVSVLMNMRHHVLIKYCMYQYTRLITETVALFSKERKSNDFLCTHRSRQTLGTGSLCSNVKTRRNTFKHPLTVCSSHCFLSRLWTLVLLITCGVLVLLDLCSCAKS